MSGERPTSVREARSKMRRQTVQLARGDRWYVSITPSPGYIGRDKVHADVGPVFA